MLVRASRSAVRGLSTGAAKEDYKVVKAASEFDALNKGPQRVLAYFTASWCGPCRAIAPVFSTLAKENNSKVRHAPANFRDRTSPSPERPTPSITLPPLPTIVSTHPLSPNRPSALSRSCRSRKSMSTRTKTSPASTASLRCPRSSCSRLARWRRGSRAPRPTRSKTWCARRPTAPEG
jgi:thiol-disulfide isomerase/thioredoxin